MCIVLQYLFMNYLDIYLKRKREINIIEDVSTRCIELFPSKPAPAENCITFLIDEDASLVLTEPKSLFVSASNKL